MAEYFHINYEFSREKALERIDACCDHRGEGAAYVVVADGNVLVQVHKYPLISLFVIIRVVDPLHECLTVIDPVCECAPN